MSTTAAIITSTTATNMAVNAMLLNQSTNNRVIENAHCRIVLDEFDSKTATVAQMQEYSECVQMIHPDLSTGIEIIFCKLLFISALLGMAIAGYKASQKKYNNGFDMILLEGLFWFFVAPILFSIFSGILYGIYWLFT